MSETSPGTVSRSQPGRRPGPSDSGFGLIVLILILGVGSTVSLYQWFQGNAEEDWQKQAARSQQWLSGTVLAWLEESYAPISGVGILFENSTSVTEDEFLLAIDALEARATTIFIDTVAVVRPEDGAQALRWKVQFSSNYLDDALAPGAALPENSAIVAAIDAALSRPGRIVLGAPVRVVSGAQFLPVALALADSQGDVIVVGFLDFDALVRGLYEIHAPKDVTLSAEAHFPTLEGQGPLRQFYGKADGDARYSSAARTVSAGADLRLNWGFGPDFDGGPDVSLPRAVALGGVLLTGIIALFAYMLLAQTGRIRKEVESKTAELKRQTEIVNLALENMGEGLLLVDEEGYVAAHNALGLEYFGLTEEEVKAHPDYEDLLRYFWTEKYDQPEVLKQALKRDNEPTKFDRETDDGKIIEVRHRPLGGVGFVRMFLDVTDQRRATEELERQKSIADQALENMGEGILLVDGDGQIAAYNQLGAEYFGLTDEEIARYPTYRDLLAYLFLEKYPNREAYEQRIRELEANTGHQIDRVLPNGRILEVRHRPMSDGGFVRMFLDVTASREAARELERQTTIANLALENMDEGILLIDAEDRPAAVNQLALDMFHLTREEFDRCETHEDLIRFVHTEKLNTPELIDQLLKDVHSQQPYTQERIRQDGRIIETRHMPMADGGCVRMYTDITERKRTAAELEDQKAMLDLALGSMDEGLMLVNGEDQIKAWNQNVLETFMIDEETMKSYSEHDALLRYLHMENLGSLEHYESDRANLKSTEPWVMERVVPDGTIWQTRFYPLEDGGFITLYNDVTQRRAEEEELIAARQVAEDSARSKSEFLANMSHEIRTPMNAIIGMSQLALKSDLTPRQHNYVDKVHRSAVGLLGIINDILDFSKIEAGKLEIESIGFRLEEVMDNLVTLVGFRAEEKGLELLLDVAADVPRQLCGDPLRLGQILVNLANNAVKFTDEGEVVVRVRSVERDEDKVQLEFSVRDTGIGMTVEEKARLFKAFSQADASTTRKFGGTGLGLTISKRLVDAMDGEITVNSKPHMGSEFIFTIELGWAEDAGALPSASDLALEDLRVLVVDDNPTARTIFNELVTSLGFRADLASSGEEALELVAKAAEAEDPYEVLLVDWQMPHMDGVATVQAMVERGLNPDAQAVLMVTAYGREEASEAGVGLPINSILTKPLNASILLDAILVAQGREALSHRLRQSGDVSKEYASQLAGAHVLLVEDNDINQELALELLQGAGMRVDVANHGREALDMLNNTDYDGVLMDIQMPVMDGYTATEKIREQERFANLPVIAMTANALVGDRERALEVGMNDHIAKPLNVATMFATMARWIKPSAPGAAVTVAATGTDGELPELTGIDTRAGLATCGGKQTLYRKLLRKFLAANEGFDQQFEDALADKDKDAPRRLAHTLKGTAASIGAGDVSLAAAELEAACKSDESLVAGRRKAVVRSLKPVLASLAGADWLEEEKGTDAPGDGINAEAMAELRNLLENADTRASQQAESLAAAATEAQQALLASIIEQIELFDFDAALEALATMEQQSEATEATA